MVGNKYKALLRAPSAAQFAADVDARHSGQHEVQNHQVVVVGGVVLEGRVPIRRNVDRIGLLSQRLREHARGIALVLDHQDSHRPVH